MLLFVKLTVCAEKDFLILSAMLYTKYFISIISFLILTVNYAWAGQTVRLLSERHRTEWNWVEYRISLTNTSSVPILNPEIHYYAADSVLSAAVDYATYPYSVTPSVTLVGGKSDIKLDVHGVLHPGHKVDVNFRIHHRQWGAYDFSKDWSYQQHGTVQEPNYFMTVYDASHQILWGSDPFNGNYNVDDAIAWTDRGKNVTVNRFNKNSDETIPAGRFWMFKDTPLSPKERDLLAQMGISKLSIGKSRGKIVAVFASSADIRKKTLDSLVAGFYNAIPVADSVAINIKLTDEDLYTETDVCDSNGDCHKEVTPRSEFEVSTSCWADIDLNDCISMIHSCGGQNIGVARGFLVTTVTKDSLQCLSRNKKIETLNVQRKMKPLLNTGREGINISSVQDQNPDNLEKWQSELAKERADLDWLKDVDYTGEGIVVGVYDLIVDFDHPAFNEYDSEGFPHARIMREEEYYGFNYNGAREKMKKEMKLKDYGGKSIAKEHGTSVTGILGGNGNNSSNYEYRGIAPKVHFYTNDLDGFAVYNQVGHVTNHSHVTTYDFYGQYDFAVDYAVFNNWKSACTGINVNDCVEGDALTKTVVIAAANNGYVPGYGLNQSYYSILSPAKNPINVGMINAVEKTRAHLSSMGPTWDGRIKPDIMAPGSSRQMAVDENNPFEVWIEYIKVFKNNESIPSINIDLKTNNVELGTEINPPVNPCKKESGLLHCLVNHHPRSEIHPANGRRYYLPPASELYIPWKLATQSTTFSKTDKVAIEVKYKIVRGKYNWNSYYGQIYFGTCSGDECAQQLFNENGKVQTIWQASGEFETTRIEAASLNSNVNAEALRIDFDFTKGITSPDICRNDDCGYVKISGSGTSAAAPFVSGVAALMYQKFRTQTGDPLNEHSMRNSTTKALMIHSAVDMEDSEDAHYACNTDLTVAHNDGGCHFTPYGKGPDFATGWGYIDGKAALDLISDYDKKAKEFPKFKEIEIGNGFEKRWTINVNSVRNRLRTTLVWDDAPGSNTNKDYVISNENFKEPKLVNDLDMYLISPSGKYYYPWRLDPLPTDFIDEYGKISSVRTGLENIHESDVKNAYNTCASNINLGYECFDHLNNVEVVDVEDPELGEWQVVVFGRSVTEFNNASNDAQVATLVSDLKLSVDNKCSIVHDYAPQTDYSCSYNLGKNLVYYVTFDGRTNVGDGDDIVLTDENGNTLGVYTGNQLAGRTIKVKSKKLTVTLHSNNDSSQGWGFAVSKIGTAIPAAILKMPFEAIKKKRKTP